MDTEVHVPTTILYIIRPLKLSLYPRAWILGVIIIFKNENKSRSMVGAL